MDLHCCENVENELTAAVDPVLLTDTVLEYMLKAEDKYTPQRTNITCSIQQEVTPMMREVVSEWMMEVCEEQKCQDEVFLLAMNYLNRFLNICNIRKNQLQLLGAACMLLASKYREPLPLSSDTLVYYTDHSISKELLSKWELLVLSKLNWDIGAVVPIDFLPHLLRKLPVEKVGINQEVIKSHTRTLITLCAKEFRFAGDHPSKIACASVVSALCGLGWTIKCRQSLDDLLERLQEITTVDKDLLSECVNKIDKMVQETSENQDPLTNVANNESTTASSSPSSVSTANCGNSVDTARCGGNSEAMIRPQEFTPPPGKGHEFNNTANTPTDVYDVHF